MTRKPLYEAGQRVGNLCAEGFKSGNFPGQAIPLPCSSGRRRGEQAVVGPELAPARTGSTDLLTRTGGITPLNTHLGPDIPNLERAICKFKTQCVISHTGLYYSP
jgi:hypothetical protein